MRTHQVCSYGPGVTAQERTSDSANQVPAGHPGGQHYEIRVEGHLGSRWSAWFDGFSLRTADDGTTVMVGPVADQAALHGLLQKLRDVGITLVSLTQISSESSMPNERP